MSHERDFAMIKECTNLGKVLLTAGASSADLGDGGALLEDGLRDGVGLGGRLSGGLPAKQCERISTAFARSLEHQFDWSATLG